MKRDSLAIQSTTVHMGTSGLKSAQVPDREPETAPEQVQVFFVLLPHSLLLDWAGPAEAFRLANQAARQAAEQATKQPVGLAANRAVNPMIRVVANHPPFALRFVGPQEAAASSVGTQLCGIEPLPTHLPPGCWVVLVGSPSEHFDLQSPSARAVTHWLRQVAGQWADCTLVTVCAGALYAAHAGLLAGRRVTTHHMELDELQRVEPACEVLRNRVFVVDEANRAVAGRPVAEDKAGSMRLAGAVVSSAGITTGIDLAIHLIAQQCGEALAARVAQTMVVGLRRGPQDPQLSEFLAHRQHLHAGLHRVQDAVCSEPAQLWDVPQMAQLANTSPRHLGRLFAEHAGLAPLAYLRRIRLGAAQTALSQGLNVNQAALAAGFASSTQLRRAWAQFKGVGQPRDLKS